MTVRRAVVKTLPGLQDSGFADVATQAALLKRLFRHFDRDNSGLIDAKEFRAGAFGTRAALVVGGVLEWGAGHPVPQRALLPAVLWALPSV